MSSPHLQSKYIVQDEGICGGQPRIDGTRLKIQHIVLEYERLGWSPDQICDAHPGIKLTQVHAAISYYYDNKEELDKSIREDKEFAERLKAGLI